MIEKALAAHLPLHEHFESADQVAIAHLGNEHRQQADHSLEEVLWDHIGDRSIVSLEQSLGRDDVLCIAILNRI